MMAACKTNIYGDKYWTLDDKIYYPIVHTNTMCAYKMNGKLWFGHGLIHRDGDLPAIEYASGIKYWCQNGIIHRDGILPAMEYADGSKRWYKRGVQYTLEQLTTYYLRLSNFGKRCTAKIKLMRLKKLRWIHGELLCRPTRGGFPGGQDYLSMTDYFNKLAN